MELVIILILLVVGVAFGLGVVVVSRSRRHRGVELEPPAPRPARPAGRSVEAPAAPVEVPPELEAEVEGAFASELAEPEVLEPEVVEPEVVERPRLRDRLAKARSAFAAAFTGVRTRGIDDETWDDLEEALLRADVGVGLTSELLDPLRASVKAKDISEPDQLLDTLKQEMKDRLAGPDRSLHMDAAGPGEPDVWLFVGVNGVGKTTTIGKVAAQQIEQGHQVVLAAGDTFRAAAAEQLGTWAERSGAEFVRGAEGGDPSAVIFDAVQRAAARQFDLVLADTAGRLHTKTNLMEELRKVRRVAAREPAHVTEVLLVIDATTGQNGLNQARQFTEATDVTGVVLTKLDGSAKGGIVFAIQGELGIPVKLVGVGETLGDLVAFDPDEFVDALFDE